MTSRCRAPPRPRAEQDKRRRAGHPQRCSRPPSPTGPRGTPPPQVYSLRRGGLPSRVPRGPSFREVIPGDPRREGPMPETIEALPRNRASGSGASCSRLGTAVATSLASPLWLPAEVRQGLGDCGPPRSLAVWQRRASDRTPDAVAVVGTAEDVRKSKRALVINKENRSGHRTV
jgi:hypothetical protein